MMKKQLRNIKGREQLESELKSEPFERKTVSFYRYIKIKDPQAFRDTLFEEWKAMRVLGRVYISHEGINAQINVPEPNWEGFKTVLFTHNQLNDMPFKIGLSEHAESFVRLTIKIKDKIVADGLNEDEIDLQNIGKHVEAIEMNQAVAKAKQKKAIIMDMRNHYEYEVGHFEQAVCPNTETFREALPKAVEMAEDFKEKEVVLYCTGGIRCEKASAYFKEHGFTNVKQLHGGIIAYKHQVDAQKTKNKYKGKNFVFDGRTAESVSDEVISTCHQCGKKSDTHINCMNNACHLLFIQCKDCNASHGTFCGPLCKDIASLPKEKQVLQRKNRGCSAKKALNVYNRHQKKDLMGVWG